MEKKYQLEIRETKFDGDMTTTQLDKIVKATLLLFVMLASVLVVLAFLGCSSSEPSDPQPAGTGTVNGTVSDDKGNLYPSTLLTLTKGSEKGERVTNDEGFFTLKTKDIGSYSLALTPPLSTLVTSNNPATVNVMADQIATVDFEIVPQPVKAHLNFAEVQILEEIVDENGNTPSSPNEPLYAKNIFDFPLGLLTPIKAPDGRQITLSEFKTAKGSLFVYCDGNSATIEISLEGMIPNGTYTFWLAYMNKTRKVGEFVDFENDFVHLTRPAIGAQNGTENSVIAGADGKINTTLTHSSCILTDQVALVIPILYHLNGTIFGGGHVPDAEEMVHMLVYFQ